MIDRWSDSFYWPALAGAWAGAVLGLLAILLPATFAALALPGAAMVGGLAAILFLAMLLDPPTRRAASAFNQTAAARSREMSWRERLFSPELGDLRLLIVNRLVWLEVLLSILTGNKEAGLLGFASFALSTLMLTLLLKRQPAFAPTR